MCTSQWGQRQKECYFGSIYQYSGFHIRATETSFFGHNSSGTVFILSSFFIVFYSRLQDFNVELMELIAA